MTPQIGYPALNLGYHGVSNSIAVEFDTFQNPELNDPSGDHVSIHTRGTNANSASELYSLASSTAFAGFLRDGTRTVRVVYLPGNFSVYLDNLTTPLLSVALNLDTLLTLDQGRAWVGFTSATGGSSETHDILEWSFVAPFEKPKLTLTQRAGDHAPVLNFLSAGDLKYEIQSTDSIRALTSWTTRTNLTGTGSGLQWVDLSSGAAQRFYRVLIQQ